jgi:hypothetical protein
LGSEFCKWLHPEIKKALSKPEPIEVEYNKTIFFGDDKVTLNSVGGKPNVDSTIDVEGENGRLTYNLAGIWSEVTGGKTVHSPNDEDDSNKISRAERAPYGKLADYEQRLETHAALTVKYQSPDFLKSYQLKGADESSRLKARLIGTITVFIANDSFNENPPATPSSRKYDAYYEESNAYTKWSQMNSAIRDITDGTGGARYTEYGSESICIGKPCRADAYGLTGTPLFDAIQDLFFSDPESKQILYTAFFGKPGDKEAQKANAKVEAILAKLSEPERAPQPTDGG